jgi:D-alanyl-D-alanine carboxypeptidase/D-alanyl-D-alanine-endopeptidase (penicillin-binding protein 4)
MPRLQIKPFKKLLFIGAVLVSSVSAINLPIPPRLKNNMSVMVVDSKTNKVVFSHKATIPRLIASNMKLITAAVALETLHPDFRWHTKLFYRGSINNGTLNGDLYLLGGGDPTLDDRALDEILSNLNKLGVKTIQGNLVIDNSIFNSLPTYSMLKVENYDVDTVLPDGLIVDSNVSRFTIHVKDNKIIIDNNLYGYQINNNLSLNNRQSTCGDLSQQVSIKQNTITFSGKMSRYCNDQVLEFNMLDTQSYTEMALSRAVNNLSIKLKGNIVYQNAPEKAILIYDYSSQTLEDAMIYMNHYSINLIAEAILLSLGAYTTDNNDTYKNGKQVYHSYMEKLHMLNPQFRLENGAGLSRFEYVTAEAMVNLLKHENMPELKDNFEKTLPRSGLEGSLKNNFTRFGHRVMFKTGTLNDTRAYSGYFYSKNGTKYIIVAIANNINTNSAPQMELFNGWVNKLLSKLDKI